MVNYSQYLCSQLVTIEYLDALGQDLSLTGNLEEISPTRLLVLSESNIPLGISVVVQCQGHRLNGRIQKAVRDDQLGWFSAVRLKANSRWSEKLFLPEHLFKLPIPASVIAKIGRAHV